ncbi:MAG: methyltransferase domain-containing protein [Caldilineae bacterium]|nr:MAG: methyltransferase domain-containing protein [Caldilineae bacterium]
MQPPSDIVRRSGIKQGMRVVDLGCGSGTFTLEMAKHVGENGEVFAIDIQPKMLQQLESKLQKEENRAIKKLIKVIEGSAYKIPLEDESIDVCCMISVLQEIPDRERALCEVRRILKPTGVLAVTEFIIDPDYPLSTTTINLAMKAGFVVDEMLGNFWNYTVRFRKGALTQ